MDTLRQVHLKSGHTNETWHPKADFQQWHPPTWINGITISPVPMSLKFLKHILWSSMIYYIEVISYNLLKFHWRWGFFHIPNKSGGDVEIHNIPQWHQCTHPHRLGTMKVWLHHSTPNKTLAQKKHHHFASALLKVMVISEALNFLKLCIVFFDFPCLDFCAKFASNSLPSSAMRCMACQINSTVFQNWDQKLSTEATKKYPWRFLWEPLKDILYIYIYISPLVHFRSFCWWSTMVVSLKESEHDLGTCKVTFLGETHEWHLVYTPSMAGQFFSPAVTTKNSTYLFDISQRHYSVKFRDIPPLKLTLLMYRCNVNWL